MGVATLAARRPGLSSSMAKPAPIRATLRPLELAQHLLEVELTFPAGALVHGGVAAMPAWTPGSYLVRDYARFVDRVRVLDGRGERPLEIGRAHV